MKGIILAGGTGSRMAPMTGAVNKHLLPVYDKPLLYYPLATLMLAEIREVLIISRPEDKELFESVFGDGSQLGMRIEYAVQEQPKGIAEAFIIAEQFIAGEPSMLALGDNIFFGESLRSVLANAIQKKEGAVVFGYWVPDPKRFGVVEFNDQGKVLGIEEKPENPRSHYAVTGLYCYDNRVCDFAKSLTPSKRGELEITDINRLYLEQDALSVIRLGRGFSWLDTGTPDSLLDACNFIATIERRQGLKIACIEEIAWRQGWIDDERFLAEADRLNSSPYGHYLKSIFSTGR